ncbi:DNA-binding transcriptional repressor MarR [Gemmata obscuriglobus]|uniref:MarR family transcriptional regulator n=1 Tax=Gemmata obscuriglobus TaxID=114 RepID=A0A2Z3H3E9_9BACT|nr:MarR family winged helix-turn-helix transcriptional regulator [Gemmata obscuriglobus]AWM39381.1 MarR family transcriptional regulator [Gemmata obscuriglobus]QEG27547.1 DNA-binding transcriptional repressor MarR [Gemmata obscuriglobus]VTS04613.1 family transcriptional regulator : Transcriptional regulator OS=Singulisphaera acidiphila (strain ATCC BAA-1392 / DSM 18658 / VKM B-2454 / MOB10) GN=Sinac_7315 PE=4 SV=1: MarR_2 [Gemmata obscuriglobus UQM 2246]
MSQVPNPANRVAAECLAGRFRILNRVITGIYDDAFRPHGVRISQMNVMVVIADRGPVRASDVCRLLQLDKSTLSRDLDRLLDRGWVRSTPAEGRAQDLEVTPAGRALIEKLMPAWEEAQKRVHELIGPELAQGLFAAVGKIRQANSGSAASG